jgi:hypothetical protein
MDEGDETCSRPVAANASVATRHARRPLMRCADGVATGRKIDGLVCPFTKTNVIAYPRRTPSPPNPPLDWEGSIPLAGALRLCHALSLCEGHRHAGQPDRRQARRARRRRVSGCVRARDRPDLRAVSGLRYTRRGSCDRGGGTRSAGVGSIGGG